MTSRTASLLFLLVSAVGSTGVLLALAVPYASRFDVSGPWLIPIFGMLCASALLFAGRRYILPSSMADSRGALLTVVALTAGTLATAFAVSWVLRLVGGGAVPFASALFGVWFAALWIAIDTLHRWAGQPTPPSP